MLEHDGVTLTESLVVAEYVADAFDGGTNLLPPDDALARATSRLAIELNPFGYFGLLKARAVRDADGGAAERAATDELRAALKGFDAFLGTHARGAGPFMFDEFGLVEVNLAPFVQRCCALLPALADVDPRALCAEEGLDRVGAWCAAVLARPSVIATGVPVDEMTASATAMLARIAAGGGPPAK